MQLFLFGSCKYSVLAYLPSVLSAEPRLSSFVLIEAFVWQ